MGCWADRVVWRANIICVVKPKDAGSSPVSDVFHKTGTILISQILYIDFAELCNILHKVYLTTGLSISLTRTSQC